MILLTLMGLISLSITKLRKERKVISRYKNN
jgi:hypothetical protein